MFVCMYMYKMVFIDTMCNTVAVTMQLMGSTAHGIWHITYC